MFIHLFANVRKRQRCSIISQILVFGEHPMHELCFFFFFINYLINRWLQTSSHACAITLTEHSFDKTPGTVTEWTKCSFKPGEKSKNTNLSVLLGLHMTRRSRVNVVLMFTLGSVEINELYLHKSGAL